MLVLVLIIAQVRIRLAVPMCGPCHPNAGAWASNRVSISLGVVGGKGVRVGGRFFRLPPNDGSVRCRLLSTTHKLVLLLLLLVAVGPMCPR